MNLAKIKSIDINSYLSKNGYKGKGSGNKVKYISPFRAENVPSFVVTKGEKWVDYADMRRLRGDIIDLVQFLHNVGFREAVNILEQDIGLPPSPKTKKKSSSIRVMKLIPLKSYSLIRYLNSRGISKETANKFCTEAVVQTDNEEEIRQYIMIAFRNSQGGFELRDECRKWSTSPKWYSFIKGGPKLLVFEGFFNVLSHQQIFNSSDSILCLNGAGNRFITLKALKDFKIIEFWGDNDPTGDEVLGYYENEGYYLSDHRDIYKGFNDLNDYIRK